MLAGSLLSCDQLLLLYMYTYHYVCVCVCVCVLIMRVCVYDVCISHLYGGVLILSIILCQDVSVDAGQLHYETESVN